MSGHWTLLVYKISDLYLLRFLRYRDSNWRTSTTTTRTRRRRIRRRIGEIDFLPYLPCLWSNSHQILGAHIYILTSAIILRCQKWIITESKSVNPKFQMYRYNGPRPRPSLPRPPRPSLPRPSQSTTVLCDIVIAHDSIIVCPIRYSEQDGL